MRTLGLDPGLTRAGFGIIDGTVHSMRMVACGAITTSGATPQRLWALYEEIMKLFEKYAPDAVAIEKVLFNKNVHTAMSTGQAAGVMLLAAAQSKAEIAEYTPTQMKAAATGFGGADKNQVQMMVTKLLKLDAPPKPADAADALGLAITHIAASKLTQIRKAAASA